MGHPTDPLMRVSTSGTEAVAKNYSNSVATVGLAFISQGPDQVPIWGTPAGGIAAIYQAVLANTVSPPVNVAWQTVDAIEIAVGASVATDRWLCWLDMDFESNVGNELMSLRVAQSLDGGADAASPGASSSVQWITNGQGRQGAITIMLTGLVAAALTIKAQILAGWTGATPVDITRCNLLIVKVA